MALFSLSFSLSAALSLSSINKIPFDLAIISKSGFRLFRKFWPTKLHAQHTNSRPSNGAQLFVSINFRSKSDFFFVIPTAELHTGGKMHPSKSMELKGIVRNFSCSFQICHKLHRMLFAKAIYIRTTKLEM